jgi:hypothetical protein
MDTANFIIRDGRNSSKILFSTRFQEVEVDLATDYLCIKCNHIFFQIQVQGRLQEERRKTYLYLSQVIVRFQEVFTL